jgi:hypothetical protein
MVDPGAFSAIHDLEKNQVFSVTNYIVSPIYHKPMMSYK